MLDAGATEAEGSGGFKRSVSSLLVGTFMLSLLRVIIFLVASLHVVSLILVFFACLAYSVFLRKYVLSFVFLFFVLHFILLVQY